MSIQLSRSKTSAVLVTLLVVLAGCSGLSGSGTGPADDGTATETPMTATTTESPETALSGRMLVVVEGEDHHLDTGSESDFRFDDTNRHTWRASESMSLAAALETAGVQAENDSLTIDGRTYNESDDNTTITYRVAGTPIEDPSTYQLEDLNAAHEIVVRVDTDGQQPTERLFDQSHPHPHGQLDMAVEGESINFTQEKYTMTSEAFHFHGDEEAARWHAHSLNVTVSAALSRFPGINVASDSVTYDGTMYRLDSTGNTVTVNGEPVDPTTYVVKDGDNIQVTLNETGL